MGSLQDQLLEAGLATPEQLRKIKAEQRREERREPRGRRDARDGSRTTPGRRRPPGRSRGASSGAPSAARGDAGRGKAGAAPSGRKGADRGQSERARPRPADAPSGEEASVQALNLRIRELLDRHALNDRNAETPFNFTRENTVRRVYVTDEQRRKLAGGELAVVGFRRRHHIVPAGVADEIQTLRPIVFVHRAAEPGGDAPAPGGAAEDDPYRDFPVPDDLHW